MKTARSVIAGAIQGITSLDRAMAETVAAKALAALGEAGYTVVAPETHVHQWEALRSIPPSWRCRTCRTVTETRP